MMKNLIIVLSSIAMVVCTSCSAVFSRGWLEEPELYPGTRANFSAIVGSEHKANDETDSSNVEPTEFSLPIKVLATLDLPLTIVADTLFIPFDYTVFFKTKEK